jgi:hypothetical protein
MPHFDTDLTRCHFCGVMNVPKRPADAASACAKCGALTRSLGKTVEDCVGTRDLELGRGPALPEAQLTFEFAASIR